MLLLSSVVHAETAAEADGYYVKAQTYFENQDYKSALRNVHLARIIYSNLGLTGGVSQCDSLINGIKSSTTDNNLAGYYNSIASDYLLTENPTLHEYEMTKYFAQLAKTIYTQNNNDDGITMANDLIEQADSEIQKIYGRQRQEAETYYNIARTYFINKDYPNALAYAQNASSIYNAISDQYGISKTNLLLQSINDEVENIKQNANVAYSTAMSLYGDGNISGSLVYAEKSKALYQSINFYQGVSKAQDLLSILHQSIDQEKDKRKRMAAQFFKEAEDYFVIMDCANATENIRNARALYEGLYWEATVDSEKELYKRRMYECDDLLTKILKECGSAVMLSQAEQYYAQAQEFFIKQDFDSALSYAQKARDLFQKIENYVGVSKSDSLIDSISDRVYKERMGDSNMTEAQYYYSIADYENARLFAERARSIYSTLLGTNKTSDANALLGNITDGEKKKEEAKHYYDLAYDYMQKSDYSNAKMYSEWAYGIYTTINYSIGMQESASLLKSAEDKVGQETTKFRMLLMSGAVVLIIVVIVVVNYVKKKKEISAEAERARSDRDVKRKIEEKQWEVEREVQTEDLVKKRLKEMIEEERGSIDSGADTVEEDMEKDSVFSESVKKDKP